MAKRIHLRITETAKEQIQSFLANAKAPDVLPGLLLSSETRQQPAFWHIGLYTKDQVRDIEATYASNGFVGLVAMYEAEDMELCIPQAQLVSQLEGKTLDYRDGRYVIT